MNIIFDLGGVVFKWDFAQIIDDELNDINKRELIIEHMFRHPDWAEFDRGTLTIDDMIEKGAERTGVEINNVRKVMTQIPYHLETFDGIMDLIGELKTADNHRLFILSNMPAEFTDYLEKKFSFWSDFEGVVFSGRINMIKPELEIYNFLIDKYSIDPQESVFIDDKEENLHPANQLGIKTIKFNNTLQCRNELLNHGVSL